MIKKVKPTEKQRRFVNEKLKGKSDYRAALDAGYSKNTAVRTTQNIVEKPGTQTLLEQFRDRINTVIPLEDRINTLYNGLRAFKQDITGQSYEDHPTRLQYLKYLNELTGIEVDKKAQLTVDGDLNIQIINFKGSSNKDED